MASDNPIASWLDVGLSSATAGLRGRETAKAVRISGEAQAANVTAKNNDFMTIAAVALVGIMLLFFAGRK